MLSSALDHFLVIFDFFGGHASASPQVLLLSAVVLFYVGSFSFALSIYNYFSQSLCPWPQGFDLGMVFVATSTVQFSEGEALALVNEQTQDHNGVAWVLEI